MDLPERTAFRRALLAVCVLDDVDVDPRDDGWTITTTTGITLHLASSEVIAATQGLDADSHEAIGAVRRWLHARLRLHGADPADLAARARPVALPSGHVLHPGPAWVRRTVLGGVLDVGLGLRGLYADPERVDILHPALADALGVHAGAMAEQADRYLEDMSRLAATRVQRDPLATLRPLGDCDVLTLLSARVFRTALVATDPTGMRTAAVPMRHRGWLDLGRIDPAFALAAATCTEPQERGVDRPLLITVDEVVLARPGGRPMAFGATEPISKERRATPAGRLG